MKRITDTTDRRIGNSLERWLDHANKDQWKAGFNWYKEAQDFCSDLANSYGEDHYKCAGVISALSPNNKWARNKIDAIALLEAHALGKNPEDIKVCTYHANKLKAFDILNDRVSLSEKSPKTHSFAMNVGLLSPDHVTSDKWHIRASLAKPVDGVTKTVESVTPAQFRRLEQITVKLARKFGLKGYQAQAIIWVTIKDHWNR